MRRWVHPEKARYYQADLDVDLLGDWSVITAWGGLGSHWRRVRKTWVPTYQDGLKRLREIEKRRRQRGYVVVDGRDGCSAAASPVETAGHKAAPLQLTPS